MGNLGTFAKKIWVPASLVWWATYLWLEHPEVFETVWTVAGTVDNLISPMYNTALNAMETVPFGEFAPFAFPMVAWYEWGKKLADLLKVEKEYLRTWLWLLWAWAWFVASKSVLAPYLWVYWMYKTWKILYDKQVVQRLTKWVFNPIMKVTEASKKLLIDPFISIKKWFIDNQFEKPSYTY